MAMRRTMAVWKAAAAGVVAVACLWLAGVSFRGERPPAHTAVAPVPALGLTVTVEISALSELTEFERRVTLTAAGEDAAKLRVRTADVLGPANRAGLYRVDEAEIAVLGPAGGDGRFFAVGPLRRLDGPSRPPTDWTCLGAFELAMVPNAGDPARGRAQVFAFVPAADDGRGCPAPGPPPI